MKYNRNLPTRQVHLDFHTSPDIGNIGVHFSKEDFQEHLKIGNVESVTVFAKCHHSMCYYPTAVGVMHPGLSFDLTGAMIDAAHEIGVRAPVYITAGWSDEDAKAHPEWLMRDQNGCVITTEAYADGAENAPKQHFAWQMLCLNDGAYAKHIYDITEEVCRRYERVDGLFIDICVKGDACYCDDCRKGMAALGLDCAKEEDAKRYFVIKHQAFMKKCGDILKQYHPDATIFFNSGGAEIDKPEYHDLETHFEMEDLPTAWDGYNKLPLRAKYFIRKNKGIIGMTGKFHLDWGEFGGFKTKEALKAEVATMAFYGVGASIGDHLHPDGKMETQTYRNIGYAYDYSEKIAPYCFGGEPTANLGVYISGNRAADEGLSNILIENQLDYEVVANHNFADFDTVIFSAGAKLCDEGIRKLSAYIENGGKVLLMADALVRDGAFCIDVGAEYVGCSEFDCDYMVLTQKDEAVPDAPMLCNIAGHTVKVTDAEIFAHSITPYFSRTNGHFCGHQNTPHDKSSAQRPAIIKKGNVVYLSHNLPEDYFTYGAVFIKRYFMKALGLIYRGGVLKTRGLPSQARCSVRKQPEHKRYCINLLYYSPVKRGCAEIIEDIVPLYHIPLALRVPEKIRRIYLPLENRELDFELRGEEAVFTLPVLECHQTVVAEYE